MCSSKLIFWLDEIGQEHNEIVGKKSANLGAMKQMGMPVPPGFAISIDAYKSFIEETGAHKEISRCGQALGQAKQIKKLEEVSNTIRAAIESRNIPKSIKADITSHYQTLCRREGTADVPVSVRSAGTVSRPGMFDTYLNVRGSEEVLEKVKKVWSSAFSTRAIAYRVNKGIPFDGDMLGITVQKLINARCAGIGVTTNPISGETSKIIIEANWGLGESVVSGAATVDRFVVNKETLEIEESTVGNKTIRVISKNGEISFEEVPPDMQTALCLEDAEVRELARLAKTLEDYLGQPQDVEWAIAADLPFPQSVFLLQTRPVRAVTPKQQSSTDRIIDTMVKIIYRL